MIGRVAFWAACFLTAILAVPAPRSWADESAGTSSDSGIRLSFEGHYGPATAAAQQIRAEAAYLRAYGQMQKDLADARIRHAEARRLEGANEVQAVRDHILKRDLIEADRARRIGKKLTDRRKLNERILERLKNHPELNTGEIVSGVALNFLKDRLSSTFVTFRAESMGSDAAAREVAAQLHLTPETVHGLQVRQSLLRGQTQVFRLDEGVALQADWWPPALRASELRPLREKFKQARDLAVEAQGTTLPEEQKLDAIAKLILAHTALEDAFLKGQTRAVRVKSANAFVVYQEGKAFLQSLGAEIRRLERLGPGGASPQGLAFRGNELPEMLAHMVRNGLEFAPAKPGDEPAYQRVFHMLRDLYVAVETDADVPEAPTRAVIPAEPKRFPPSDSAK